MEQCEAILITHAGDSSQAQRGERCRSKGDHKFYGHAVCWTHHKACTTGPRADGTSEPVKFVHSVAQVAE